VITSGGSATVDGSYVDVASTVAQEIHVTITPRP